MKTGFKEFIIKSWQQRIIALATAIFIWSLVNHSITTSRTIPNVPVKLINLPADKTSQKLLPTGYLMQRISLTLRGRKAVLDNLKPTNLEVVLDASNKPDDWLITVDKRDLVSKDPDIDIAHNISTVSHNELFVRLSKLVTEEITIRIRTPVGEAPPGYQWLDVWPQELKYTVSGPKELVNDLKEKGMSITFNLSDIAQDELDSINPDDNPFRQDEIAYYVPDSWKQITIPFYHGAPVTIDTPEAQKLQLTFLRKQFIPLGQEVPIRVFFPLDYSESINPDTHTFAESDILTKKNGIPVLSIPITANNVSTLFLDIVRNNIEINIIAAPESEGGALHWTTQFINASALEDQYVTLMMADGTRIKSLTLPPSTRKRQLRERFRSYMRDFRLFKENNNPLRLEATWQNDALAIRDVSDIGIGQ